jgi:hypothetical protein
MNRFVSSGQQQNAIRIEKKESESVLNGHIRARIHAALGKNRFLSRFFVCVIPTLPTARCACEASKVCHRGHHPETSHFSHEVLTLRSAAIAAPPK